MKAIIFRDYKEENWHSMDVYADSLITHLKRYYRNNIDVEECVPFAGISSLISYRNKYIRQFFRYCIYPIGAFFQQADVYHITDHAYAHVLAVLDPSKTVITCHDLTAPYWMMANLPLSLKKRIKYAVERWRLGFMKRAACIIAVSDATKRHIVRTLGIPPDKILVIPEGVSPIFTRVKDLAKIHTISSKLGLPKHYVLHVGTTYYNKNIEGLLQIFFALAKQDASLCLVKSGDPWTADQRKIIQESPYFKRIYHIGFIETSDLPVVYSMATALIQPSYAEGFGFTVLEAMACGCPVVVSNIPALREMVADAGVYIEPHSTRRGIRAIASLIKSANKRKLYTARGYLRVKKYSWTTTAEKTLNLYKRISEKRMFLS